LAEKEWAKNSTGFGLGNTPGAKSASEIGPSKGSDENTKPLPKEAHYHKAMAVWHRSWQNNFLAYICAPLLTYV